MKMAKESWGSGEINSLDLGAPVLMYSAEVKPKELADSNEECDEGRTSDLLSSGSEIDVIYGDTSALHRLGDQYQAEIPSLLSKYERLQLLHGPINSGTNDREGQTECLPFSSRSHDPHPQEIKFNIGTPDIPLESGQEFTRILCHGRSSEDDHMDEAGDYSPVLSSPVVSWVDVEVHSFLLGLYIFGKDLVQVGKFVGTKKMGDILPFYYGKFYKSDAHRKWSESRKIRGHKSIHGQKIFSGLRNKVLLSRLLPSIPTEVQENLLEAAKSFTDGRSSLEEFVFTLKDMVGMDCFVEAVGIGKRKHDLTGTILDQVRSKMTIPRCPELPVGKAFSSFTYGDIIKFLKGSRLSKANSNDLFWEAVWPRLLGRGWHSEQPKDLTFCGSKIPLVFLIPGINKFSRRKLARGSHYFDSVSDVLNTVAMDPTLIELDSDGVKGSGNCNDERKWNEDPKSDQNCPSDQKHHCNLRLKFLNSSPKPVKFMDTGLFQREVSFKVLNLPIQTYRASSSSGVSDGRNSEDLVDSDVSSNDQKMSATVISEYKFGNTKKCNTGKGVQPDTGKGVQSDPVDRLVSVSKQRLATNFHDSSYHYSNVLNKHQPIKDRKCQYDRRVNSTIPKHLAPLSKRQKLISSDYAGDLPSSFSRAHQLKKVDAYRARKPFISNEIIGPEAWPSKLKARATSNKNFQVESSKCNSDLNFSGTGATRKAVFRQEKPALFDLNIPQFPPDFDASEPFCTDMDNFNPREPSFSSETKHELDASTRVEQSTDNARRKGTRNRMPTARALEAIACEFIGAKRKGRGLNILPADDLDTRPSRRPRRAVGVPGPAHNSNAGLAGHIASSENISVKKEYHSTRDYVGRVFNKPHAWSERLCCSQVLD